MLGKTAGGLYWMFRLLERSENIARLLDAGFSIALTRSAAAESEWASIVATAGVDEAYRQRYDAYTAASVVDFLLRDKSHASSVMSAVDNARSNARLVRTALTREVWEATNECWMTMKALLQRPVAETDLPDVLASIRRQNALVRSALSGTMLRNDIYNFAQIGAYIERADNPARILDMVASGKYIWLDTNTDVLVALQQMDLGRACASTRSPITLARRSCRQAADAAFVPRIHYAPSAWQ